MKFFYFLKRSSWYKLLIEFLNSIIDLPYLWMVLFVGTVLDKGLTKPPNRIEAISLICMSMFHQGGAGVGKEGRGGELSLPLALGCLLLPGTYIHSMGDAGVGKEGGGGDLSLSLALGCLLLSGM